MPVNFFDSEAFKFYLVILALASPFLLLGWMIIYQIRQTDRSWYRRGFEVKTVTGEASGKKEKQEQT